MGFYESDRIIRKNAEHNAAYNLYENLINEGFTEDRIVDYCNEELKSCNSDRYEIIQAVKRIVGRSRSNEVINSGGPRPRPGCKR